MLHSASTPSGIASWQVITTDFPTYVLMEYGNGANRRSSETCIRLQYHSLAAISPGLMASSPGRRRSIRIYRDTRAASNLTSNLEVRSA